MGHTLTGIASGALVLAGGWWPDTESYNLDIYLLKNDAWAIIGQMQEVSNFITLAIHWFFLFNYMGAAISFGQYIYAVAGAKEDSTGQYAVQRIQIDANDEFVDTVVINRHDSRNWIPVLQASTDYRC